MEDINLIFLKKFIALQSNYLGNYKTVEEKYLNGYCQDLVFYFHLLNQMDGVNIRISELRGNDIEILHFVYRSNDGKFYDINGGFDTIEELVEKCPLFSNYAELSIQADYLEISEEDLEDDYIEVKKLFDLTYTETISLSTIIANSNLNETLKY